MQFLIPLRDLPLLINPYQCILYPFAFGRWFMDADVDGEFGFRGGFLETAYEEAIGCGADEGDGFGGGGGYVVACFGEEEGLGRLRG